MKSVELAQIAAIVHEVKMRSGEHDETRARGAIHEACANLLAKPGRNWPGEHWQDQITLEAVRLLKERP